MTWPAVIVFAALATAAVVVVVGYHRGNRKIAAAAEAAQTDTPLATLESEVDPDRDEAPTDSWIWR
jgi:hypothetical protein